MPNTGKGSSGDQGHSRFASTLRDLMKKNGTTQRELANFLDVRPQTISLYCIGETQPNVDKLMKIAEFFDVTTDYLATGVITENVPVYEMTGLSQGTVENLKLVKEGYFEESPYMLALLDLILGDKDFYTAMERAASFQKIKMRDRKRSDYYDYKSSQALTDYFLSVYPKDIKSIYNSRKGR